MADLEISISMRLVSSDAIVRQNLNDFKREPLVAAATFPRAIIIASRDALETDISVLTNTVARMNLQPLERPSGVL